MITHWVAVSAIALLPMIAVAAEVPSLEESQSQVTSVSELRDVQPTDWGFQALQSLIERYGAIAGYPDGTFKGNRPISRFEFAAGLNAILGRIEELVAQGIPINQEDLQTLNRLVNDYQDVLGQLRSRLEDLDRRTAKLEDEQFSTTTYLRGRVTFAPTGGSERTSFVAYGYLDFWTYFNPKSLLYTELEFGNSGEDSISVIHERGQNFLGSNGELADGGGIDLISTDNAIALSRLSYSFQPFDRFVLTVGAKMTPSDFIDYNRFANDASLDFISGFFNNNPLIVQNQLELYPGAGVALNWQLGETPFAVNALYIASDASDPSLGFFGDRYQGSVELSFSPSSTFSLRLQYTHAEINHVDINAFGLNAAWLINRQFGVFSRLGFGSYQGFNTVLERDFDASPVTWSVGAVWRDLIIPGSHAGVALGQPFITEDLGDSTQTNFEAFYNLSLNPNLTITPALLLVNHADNESSNGLTWETVLRMVFSF